jgi:nucleotide-binding universal stress UspA family protein
VETIVVGVDGSAGSDAALRWALAEAKLRGAKVRVVHIYRAPQIPLSEAGLVAAGGMPIPAPLPENGDRLRRAAETRARNLIHEALKRAESESFGVEIEQAPLEGSPAETLIATARAADLLVVGSRGHGGFLGLLLGSVSQQCAHHPPCPVVILPNPEDGGGAE